MYYYIENKTEYIQSDNLCFKEIHIPQQQPLGKILSEIINLDYSVPNQKTYNESRKRKYVDIDNVCKETEILYNFLFAMNFRPLNTNQVDTINEIINEIKYIIQRDDFNELSPSFIFYYLVNKFNVQISTSNMFIDSFANSASAPVLSKYMKDDRDTQILISKIFHQYFNHKLDDRKLLLDELLNQLKLRGMKDIHYKICKKIFSNNPFTLYPNTINDHPDKYGLTKDEAFEYQKLTYEYNNGNIYKVINLQSFIILSFAFCCKNDIKPARCEYCGNLYFKHGKSKYCCEGCLKAAKSQQKSNRNYTYIDSAGEEHTINYDDILRNFEGKVSKVIKYVSKTDEITSDSSRKIIESRLSSYKLMYRNERNNIEDKIAQSNNQNEKDAYYETVAELLYKVENLYTERNSLKNAVKDSIEQNKNIILKYPKLNGYDVVDDDFVIEYLE